MDMIVPIKRGTAQILYASKDGVCLKDTKSGAYMLSAKSYAIGDQMLNLLPTNGLFTFHQDFMLDSFKVKVRYKTSIVNFQTVYFSTEPCPVSNNIELKPLNISHFDVITKHYGVDVGLDYVHDTITEGRLFGGFAGHNLVGFVGIHAEGSIGFLKVFDQYRNKGYGTALAGHITNYQLSHKAVPFAQICIDNAVSLAVFKRVGFQISTEKVYWLF